MAQKDSDRALLARIWKQMVYMLVEQGDFDAKSGGITGDNLPYDPKLLCPSDGVELMHIDDALKAAGKIEFSTEEVENCRRSLGYRTATWMEILWARIKNRLTYRTTTPAIIVALGSKTMRHEVVCIKDDGQEVVLGLEPEDRLWTKMFMFAVVREDKK